MALPASGTITMYQVAVELGIAANGVNLNDSRVRTLAKLPSGQISMWNLLGKSNITEFTITVGYQYVVHYYGYCNNSWGWSAGVGDATVSGKSATFGSVSGLVACPRTGLTPQAIVLTHREGLTAIEVYFNGTYTSGTSWITLGGNNIQLLRRHAFNAKAGSAEIAGNLLMSVLGISWTADNPVHYMDCPVAYSKTIKLHWTP